MGFKFLFIFALFLCPELGHSNEDRFHTQTTLLAEVKTIQPGSPFWVGLQMKMDPKWHTYWKNPGDSGGPTKIEWTLPEGFKSSDIYWPFPKRIETPPLVTFGYEDEIMLLVQIRPPRVYKGNGKEKIRAHVKWLECADVCIPREAKHTLTLPVLIDPPQIDSNQSATFSKARSNLAIRDSEWILQAMDQGHNLRIQMSPPEWFNDGIGLVEFFPSQVGVIDHAAEQRLSRKGKSYVLNIARPESDPEPLENLSGILVSANGWRGQGSERSLLIEIPIKPASRSMPLSLGFALLFAFIGGLLLNVMPCVLPVLSIKILGLMGQHDLSASDHRRHGWFYTLGVLLAFWLLVGLIYFIRLGGTSLGWGFQLQNPIFILVMATFFLLFALNLFGFFEVGTSFLKLNDLLLANKSGRPSIFQSVFSGVLATIVATPCTAPFMGAALGFALTQSLWISFLVFTVLGFGMAFPYLLLTYQPQWVRLLPKPGPWMNTVKKVMGVLMLATVVWLLWVFDVQMNVTDRFFKPSDQQTTGIKWEPYSDDQVDILISQERIVFVDFTAAWCLTCQVNERVVFRNKTVIDEVKRRNIAMIKADWTNRDDEITQALQRIGRSGVPVYQLIVPGRKNAPILLPEILTPGIFLDALNENIRSQT